MSKANNTQLDFTKPSWKFRYCYGGSLRKKRKGRGARPLSAKHCIHLVFKTNLRNQKHLARKPITSLRSGKNFDITNQVIKIYALRFFVKIEQLSIQHDHIHLLIRTTRRSLYQNFFRVVAGQIAQRVQAVTDTPKQGISFWKERPFTRIVAGSRAFKTVMNYIRLNEMEVLGRVPYQKLRLKGLSAEQIASLWT